MDGRWTITRCPTCGIYEGPLDAPALADCDDSADAWEIVPVVPCDDAAIERVARRLAELQGYPTGPHHLDMVAAMEVLKAAGETDR